MTFFRLVLLLTLLVSGSASGAGFNWGNAASSLGDSLPDIYEAQRQDAAIAREREERQLRYEQEKRLLDERIRAQRVFIREQQEVQKIIVGLFQQISDRNQHIASLTKDNERLAARVELLAARVELLTVDVKHPKWRETLRTPAFTAWIDRQPPETKSLAESEKAADAIRLLDQYSTDSKKRKERK